MSTVGGYHHAVRISPPHRGNEICLEVRLNADRVQATVISYRSWIEPGPVGSPRIQDVARAAATVTVWCRRLPGYQPRTAPSHSRTNTAGSTNDPTYRGPTNLNNPALVFAHTDLAVQAIAARTAERVRRPCPCSRNSARLVDVLRHDRSRRRADPRTRILTLWHAGV